MELIDLLGVWVVRAAVLVGMMWGTFGFLNLLALALGYAVGWRK
jgi:hypothetical protein